MGPALGMNLTGRAVALTGAVSMPGDGGTVIGGCSAALPPGAAAPVPTLSEWAMILLASLMALGGFAAMRRQGIQG